MSCKFEEVSEFYDCCSSAVKTDWDLPVVFTERRHLERINVVEDDLSDDWRPIERMKTVSVALVMCLHIGIDPPDVIKTVPCARMECWVDPATLSSTKAIEAIGNGIHKQYEYWQPRARYKQSLDPTIEDINKLCVSLRRTAKDERALFHYNGHGMPKPTINGEIWAFDQTFTQYMPLSFYDLHSWMGSPSVYVYDCSNAGVLIDAFKKCMEEQKVNVVRGTDDRKGRKRETLATEETTGVSTTNRLFGDLKSGIHLSGRKQRKRDNETETANTANVDRESEVESSTVFDVKLDLNSVMLTSCSANETLPMNPELPADLFTCCLTTPIKTSFFLYSLKEENSELSKKFPFELIDMIPGQLNDRRTMLGELNWIFTAITDTIAWNVLKRDQFQQLFRQDLLVASLFRNFLFAERVMRKYDCIPLSHPAMPATYNHLMWQSWDMTMDHAVLQLQQMIKHNNFENYKRSSFFEDQLTSFEVWLNLGHVKDCYPEQLPVILQVLLSQTHRLRALHLLTRFLDIGSWAVLLALSVGIYPYVLKLLQSPDSNLRPYLTFIWAKIIAIDKKTQIDLIRDNGHSYFVNVLQDNSLSSEHRTLAAFILSHIVNEKWTTQNQLNSNFIENNVDEENDILTHKSVLLSSFLDCLITYSNDSLMKQWLTICLAHLWKNEEKIRWSALRDNAHEKLYKLLTDDRPETRAAAVYALGTLLSSAKTRTEHSNAIDQAIIMQLLSIAGNDISPIVRNELIVAFQWLVLNSESHFLAISNQDERSELNQSSSTITRNHYNGYSSSDRKVFTTLTNTISCNNGGCGAASAIPSSFSSAFSLITSSIATTKPMTSSTGSSTSFSTAASPLSMSVSSSASSSSSMMTSATTTTAAAAAAAAAAFATSSVSGPIASSVTSINRKKNSLINIYYNLSNGIGNINTNTTSSNNTNAANANANLNFNENENKDVLDSSNKEVMKRRVSSGSSNMRLSSLSLASHNQCATANSGLFSLPVPAYGTVYMKVWNTLKQFEKDPFFHVSKNSSTIINFVKKQLKEWNLNHETAVEANRLNCSSISLPPSPNSRQQHYLLTAAGQINSCSANTMINANSIGGRISSNSRISSSSNSSSSSSNSSSSSSSSRDGRSGNSNAASSHSNSSNSSRNSSYSNDQQQCSPITRLSSFDDGTGNRIGSDSSRLSNRAPKIVNIANAATSTNSTNSLSSSTITNYNKEPLVKTKFFAWISAYFSNPILSDNQNDDSEIHLNYEQGAFESASLLEKEWKYQRNAILRREAHSEQKRIFKGKFEWASNVTRTRVTPNLMQFHPYDQKIAISDSDILEIYDWATSAQLGYLDNRKNKFSITRITSLNWLNSHDYELLLIASDDGSIRIWKPPNEEHKESRVLSAWQAYNDLKQQIHYGIITSWEQTTSTLITGGDARTIRLWDMKRELKKAEFVTGTDSSITALDSSYSNLKHNTIFDGERAAKAEDGNSDCEGDGEGDDKHKINHLTSNSAVNFESNQEICYEGLIAAGCADGSVRLFDRRCSPQESRIRTWREYSNSIAALKLSNTNSIAAISIKGLVKYFDIRKSYSLSSFDVYKSNNFVSSNSCKNLLVSFHPEIDIFSCIKPNYGSVNLYGKNGTVLNTLPFSDNYYLNHSTPLTSSLTFHPKRVSLAETSVNAGLTETKTSNSISNSLGLLTIDGRFVVSCFHISAHSLATILFRAKYEDLLKGGHVTFVAILSVLLIACRRL